VDLARTLGSRDDLSNEAYRDGIITLWVGRTSAMSDVAHVKQFLNFG
jgi:hypothetical protein